LGKYTEEINIDRVNAHKKRDFLKKGGGKKKVKGIIH
jgi:hypothetical protein